MATDERLLAAVDGRRGTEAADRLCEACVMLFDVDAAAISIVFDGINKGTLGSSDEPARRFDEVQFVVGEGPCLETVTTRVPVSITDLADPAETRWPAYGRAMLAYDIRGIHAMPVAVAGEYIGALDLFTYQPGTLNSTQLSGAIAAAELAAVPLLDLLTDELRAAVDEPGHNAWAELNALSRVEVSQATGMLVALLSIDPAEALVRLRAHAYATGRTATDVARDILDGRLTLEAD
ncbi:GAF and ANTAR domain-containing protein [Mycolicibacterium sp. S2-37]|uniref:GAF and ANTAR domain-containing protein n=1 Tax=Mycolicibacterium sp. S2-37 TaxID=2810297 RepID=UPI001A942CB9|nr:GAF and ANTAR domain-containing protein [Mycolicibacterium sp. S2-37]MBO0679068.1 GAF and ANTAR domain-containing protein [Mycolicibacterium sp. S2-37]